jgi:hypothetical protein
MQFVRNKSKATSNSGFLNFIERYWLVLVGLLLAYPYIVNWIKQLKVVNKETTINQETGIIKAENAPQNLTTIQSKSDKILERVKHQSDKDRLIARSKALAGAMGQLSDNSWWSSLFINRSEAVTIIKQEVNNIKYIEQLYQYVFTDNQNLRSDVLNFLLPAQREDIRKYYKDRNKTFI